MTRARDASDREDGFEALLDAVYAAPLEPVPWQGLLARLRDELDALAATLILRPPTPEDPGLLLTEGGAARWTASYQERYFVLDPFVDLPLGEVVALDEVVPLAELLASEFYRRFMEPAGVLHVIGFDVREPDGLEARLRISRSGESPAFGERERGVLARLAPHLRRAVRIQARVARTESERDLFAGAIDRLSMGTILLDERGRVLRTNRVADDLLRRGVGLSVAGGRLRAAGAEASRGLERLIERALADRAAGRPSLVQGLRLRRPDGGALSVLARPVPPAPWSEGSGAPALAIFVGDPDERPAVPLELVRQLFGFTRAEALLATALARGQSLDESAAELGIARNTARAHLRAIFAKTGASRQAELVRLVLRSVAAVG
jgi:DNA-binding CsgD family transcriptional regulator/PAS domain-containing protein